MNLPAFSSTYTAELGIKETTFHTLTISNSKVPIYKDTLISLVSNTKPVFNKNTSATNFTLSCRIIDASKQSLSFIYNPPRVEVLGNEQTHHITITAIFSSSVAKIVADLGTTYV